MLRATMIPEFDLGDVLPPYIGGGPADLDGRSPYLAAMSELVDRFGTSPQRNGILQGLLDYRSILRNLGVQGFQWVGGSFVEDCESARGRPPRDVDLVTFVTRPAGYEDDARWEMFADEHPEAFHHATIKDQRHCDTYFVEMGSGPDDLVSSAVYWYGLFSHQRGSARWKGMVQIELDSDDPAAQILLQRGDWA